MGRNCGIGALMLVVVVSVVIGNGVVVSAQLSSGALNLKPTKTYERAMNQSLQAEAQLNICRAAAARSGENLVDLNCFAEAMKNFAYNATWNKQYAALAMMTAQRREASSHFNASAQITLEAQAFRGHKNSPDFKPAVQLTLYKRREP